MSSLLSRGAVVRVRFDPAEGSEIQKTRPAVVVSNSVACRFDSVVQVVPVTRFPNRDLRPYEALISSGESGVDKPSRLVANQIRTVSKTRISEYLGHVTQEEQLGLDRTIRIQLGLAID
jgi:mRNA interferase MazF